VKAALRDKRRQEARARRQQLLDGEPGSLVTKEERRKIWDQVKARGDNDVHAAMIMGRVVAQLEAARREEKRLVKPINGQGLLVPSGRMIITPDEARQTPMGQ
jgi:hypothetical protein